jgi:DNA-binding NarL/FixJ family response regulator
VYTYGFRYHRQDRMPGEDLATRICVMHIEDQVDCRRLMAASVDRQPSLERAAEAGASEIMDKNVTPGELFGRIRCLGTGAAAETV